MFCPGETIFSFDKANFSPCGFTHRRCITHRRRNIADPSEGTTDILLLVRNNELSEVNITCPPSILTLERRTRRFLTETSYPIYHIRENFFF